MNARFFARMRGLEEVGVYNGMMLSQTQIDQMREYVEDKPVEVVYLFGSQATDAARIDSDHDFGVLFEEGLDTGKRFDLVLDMISEFGAIVHSGDKTDVVDLNRAYLRFQFEAIRLGMVVYVRNQAVRKDFEYKVQQSYFDEMYYMKQAARHQMRAIARGEFGVQ